MNFDSYIFFSGEDELAEALARRCVEYTLPSYFFHSIRPVQGGKDNIIKNKLQTYFETASKMPLLLFIDQDTEVCPPAVKTKILDALGKKELPLKFLLSVISHESEAWLLGDRDNFSRFLGVSVSEIPEQPETIADPKQTLIDAARLSQKYSSDICPQANLSAKVGPGYNAVLCGFVNAHWKPNVAAECCPTLKRTLDRLNSLNGVTP